jgi:hypothetical protein
MLTRQAHRNIIFHYNQNLQEFLLELYLCKSHRGQLKDSHMVCSLGNHRIQCYRPRNVVQWHLACMDTDHRIFHTQNWVIHQNRNGMAKPRYCSPQSRRIQHHCKNLKTNMKKKWFRTTPQLMVLSIIQWEFNCTLQCFTFSIILWSFHLVPTK